MEKRICWGELLRGWMARAWKTKILTTNYCPEGGTNSSSRLIFLNSSAWLPQHHFRNLSSEMEKTKRTFKAILSNFSSTQFFVLTWEMIYFQKILFLFCNFLYYPFPYVEVVSRCCLSIGQFPYLRAANSSSPCNSSQIEPMSNSSSKYQLWWNKKQNSKHFHCNYTERQRERKGRIITEK